MSPETPPHFIWVLLSYYSDGSDMGKETVLAAFSHESRANRFVELANATMPSKKLEVVCVEVEP